eukprot:15478-Heterococcus_DN1.PRE.2
MQAAPDSVKNFLSVVTGEYKTIDYNGSTVTRVDVVNNRIDFGKLPRGRDRYEVRTIDGTGRVRRQSKQAADELLSSDSNTLRHDTTGVVSIANGGGTFEFTVTPGPNGQLDATHTVIGQTYSVTALCVCIASSAHRLAYCSVLSCVLSGMDVLAAICAVPVSKEDILGSKKAFAGAGKGFDPRARIASVDKPLSKITVVKAGVLVTLSSRIYLVLQHGRWFLEHLSIDTCEVDNALTEASCKTYFT